MSRKSSNNTSPVKLALIIGAIGVVFGDIGTSPLYALRAVFDISNLQLTSNDVYGIISMILWSVVMVVSIKYVSIIMRTDNNGEGGIMTLVALLSNSKIKAKTRNTFIMIALLGVALFYGDSVMTPATSVLSAVEGISLVNSSFSSWVIPIAIIILTGLFVLQSRGSGKIGMLFGPIMIIWFLTSGLGGLWQVSQHTDSLIALLPTTAMHFIFSHPLGAFLVLSGVILSITGAEALYADMGHFGRPAIMRGWFYLIFPCLILNYLGQGALVIANPSAINSSYFMLFPDILYIPVVILAMSATLIASQAVLAGAFSLTKQAIRLGYAPPVLVKHTSSEEEGQVYINALNWIMFIIVILLIIGFGSSSNLAAAFGLAVSATLLIDSILFVAVMRLVKQKSWALVSIFAVIFISIDTLFLASSTSKIIHGAWVPLLVATLGLLILTTWTKGRNILAKEREEREPLLSTLVKDLNSNKIKVKRVPGESVYISHHDGLAPMALNASIDQLHELSSTVVIVNIRTANVPHVPMKERASVDNLQYKTDGISYINIMFGYKDIPNVPLTLEHSIKKNTEVYFDIEKCSYFISDRKLSITKNRRMSFPRKILFDWLNKNTASSIEILRLPIERTINISPYVKL